MVSLNIFPVSHPVSVGRAQHGRGEHERAGRAGRLQPVRPQVGRRQRPLVPRGPSPLRAHGSGKGIYVPRQKSRLAFTKQLRPK